MVAPLVMQMSQDMEEAGVPCGPWLPPPAEPGAGAGDYKMKWFNTLLMWIAIRCHIFGSSGCGWLSAGSYTA